ncbi:MAG: glycosyltransferase [Chromatiales bacterium]
MLKVAVVHEWLVDYSGSERVLEQLLKMFPNADPFAVVDFLPGRIRKTYRREATVVYPPVDVERFALRAQKDDFYLTASRMAPYKKVDVIVEAFSKMPDNKLVVIGDGPDFDKVKLKAGNNVTLLGYQNSEVLTDYMQRAKAFVFAAEEDFGIALVEAQACGTPVIAFGKGGALETIRGLDHKSPTGLFFFEQSVPGLIEAIERFEAQNFIPSVCRENALRFAPERFREELKAVIEKELLLFRDGLAYE